MKANELRIGNWYDHNGEPRQVTPNTIEEVWVVERSWCKPITLKEEWFLNFGFEKVMSWTYGIHIHGNLPLVCYLGEKGWSIGFKSYSDFPNLNYVHQLQNLYFALSGKELTIKEINES
jgi:hypothetical protein